MFPIIVEERGKERGGARMGTEVGATAAAAAASLVAGLGATLARIALTCAGEALVSLVVVNLVKGQPFGAPEVRQKLRFFPSLL